MELGQSFDCPSASEATLNLGKFKPKQQQFIARKLFKIVSAKFKHFNPGVNGLLQLFSDKLVTGSNRMFAFP